MYRKYVYSGITWYDFRGARESELVDVCRLYNLAPEVIRKIVNLSHINQIVQFPHCVLISIDIPCSIDTNKEKCIKNKSIDFVLGKDFIITARHEEVRGFAEAKRALRVHNSQDSDFPMAMMQTVMTRVYEHIRHDLHEHLPQVATNHHAYALKKYLKEYDKTLEKHADVLRVFSAIALEFFANPETQKHLDSIIVQYDETHALVKNERKKQQRNKKNNKRMSSVKIAPFEYLVSLYKKIQKK